MDKWLVNGVEQDSLPLDDRGLAYGDGLFETVALREGECRFIEDHLARLADGCRRLGLVGVDMTLVANSLQRITEGVTHGTIKVIVTRGSGPRGYRIIDGAAPSIIVGIETSAPRAVPDGVKLRYCSMTISRNPRLAGIKTLNRLEQVIARAEWDDPNIAEGLMLDDRGHVICGTMTNLFVVLDTMIVTPNLDECGVRGVMRSKVIELTQKLGLACAEKSVGRDELESAEEIFLTNSQIGVWPVAELEGVMFAGRNVTRRIMQGLAELGVQECAR